MVKTWPGQITVEKTPSYFVTKDAPYRIHAVNPNIKLIVVVRNPVTRAISGLYKMQYLTKPIVFICIVKNGLFLTCIQQITDNKHLSTKKTTSWCMEGNNFNSLVCSMLSATL